MQLTEHFDLEEFTASETAERKGINNEPPPAVIDKLKVVARGMEHVRIILGVPVLILSGYRSQALNAEVGGSRGSQHMRGEACDFHAPRFGTPLAICRALEGSDVRFDQLIWEGGWVHISFIDDSKPRGEVLTWQRGKGYSAGLPAPE
jgi:hypothetical protein